MAKAPINIKIEGDYNDRDIKRVQRDLESLKKNTNQSQQEFSKMSKATKAAGIAVAAAVAGMGYAATRFAADSIRAASDLDESQSKVTAVFKDQADEVMKWAETSATAFGQSKQQALEAAGTYGNLFQAFGLTSDAAQEMSTRMVELAADLASFNNTSIDDAIQAIRSGLSGETEPLKRFGVALTDARLKAEAMAQGIYDGAGALDAGQKAQAAYAVILKDTTLAQGDFARTSDGLANTQRILQAAVEDAKAEIGTGLVDAITDVVAIMGGPKGMADQIDGVAGKLATMSVGVGAVVREVVIFNRQLAIATSGLFDFATATRIALAIGTAGISESLLSVARSLYDLGEAEMEAQETTEAWADYRRAQQGVVDATPGLVGSLDDTADAAAGVARSAAGAARALLETAIATGQVPSKARFAQNTFVQEMLDNIGKSAATAGSSARTAARSAEKMRINFNKAAKDFGDATVSIEGNALKVSQAVGTAFEARTQVFRNIVQTQIGIIQQATSELDSYADSVVNSILGSLDFATVDAEGNPMTPEQIFNAIMGDIDNREAAVQAIAESNIMTRLPEALAQKILTLPPDAAIALANYFSANPAQLEALTANYNALATFTETALGIPMAETFATIGDESAIDMIEKARERIGKAAKAFKRYVKNKLSTTITVSVRYQAVNSLPGVSGGSIDVTTRANGGPIAAGMPTLVGERGPELIVPSVDSTVVRSEYMPRGGGSTINLTVNAGIGTDGRQVGRQIVEALKQYERSNGPVPIKVA